MSSIFNTFKSALNDPALIEYAKQQGIETSDSLRTPCQNAASKSPPHGVASKSIEKTPNLKINPRTDDLIPWEVALPIGSYTVVARLQRGGEVRVRFVIKAGQRTIVDLDLAEQETYRRRLQTSDRVASSNYS